MNKEDREKELRKLFDVLGGAPPGSPTGDRMIIQANLRAQYAFVDAIEQQADRADRQGKVITVATVVLAVAAIAQIAVSIIA